jgi:MFS transporter, PAT family, beta-lactamase induction signal transducer AmpG
MADQKGKQPNPWTWIPTLYFAQGIPYVVVMLVSVIMYKRLGISNAEIALYTSWLYLPWVIKPLWSPLVDLVKTKRWWVVTMQLLVGAGLAGIAFTIPAPSFFQYSLAFMWLLAFSSATHDIAADGLYMLGLSKHNQAWFVGVRSTFYRIAMITGQGLLIIFAGYIESNSGLATVNVQVNASPNTEITVPIHPSDLNISPESGELRIITWPETIEISTNRREQTFTDSLKLAARDWNVRQNFYSVAGMVASEDPDAGLVDQIDTDAPSWWSRVVADNLGEFLRRNFGPEIDEPADDGLAGNVGVVYFYLSGAPAPGEEVVLNFGRESGDNSISLVEGERIVFTSENWNRAAMAVVQLDPKLDVASEAMFRGRAGNIPLAWSITFFLLTGMFVFFFLYHRVMLPRPDSDKPVVQGDQSIFAEFFRTFALFFQKKQIGVVLLFLLFYRFGEAQLVKLASPFLLDAQEVGGLALTTGEVGFVYGTVGILALTFGGILGGILASRHGLRFWLWPMIIAINLPNAVYIYLAYAIPDSFLLINIAVAVEQFGYGFGFTAYMLYMIYVSEGEHKTAHFAITTGFMALGMMIPGMFSGWIQEIVGYQNFFVWVLIATIPSFIIAYFVKIDADFGKKTEEIAEEGEKE